MSQKYNHLNRRKYSLKAHIILATKYNTYLSKKYWKKKIFWSDVYFACSIGEMSQAVIQKYIETQG
jgi:hypothetical protein